MGLSLLILLGEAKRWRPALSLLTPAPLLIERRGKRAGAILFSGVGFRAYKVARTLRMNLPREQRFPQPASGLEVVWGGSVPKVARGAQPWALGRNPVGIFCGGVEVR